ncbi:hypothetical protein [Paenibacillus sp. J5C2022]|uniref:hypothetical protein n=1 Tax=Paenibacillus sp. J5C2022 TaxID=2977129 RepID=UPI0021D09A7C|nr:hypothetical protein [Paenibacillus sp. J5C2022]
MIAGGLLESYLNADGSGYGVLGYPNNPEQNVVAVRGMFVQKNAGIRGTVLTTANLQSGYFDTAYYQSF